jgi:hypothetical protein
MPDTVYVKDVMASAGLQRLREGLSFHVKTGSAGTSSECSSAMVVKDCASIILNVLCVDVREIPLLVVCVMPAIVVGYADFGIRLSSSDVGAFELFSRYGE